MSTTALLNLLFAAVLVALSAAAVVRAAASPAPSRRFAPALIAVWAVAVGYMTLRPGTGLGVRLNLVPILFDGTGSAIDAVLNVFVFVPLGLLLAAAGVRMRVALPLAFAVTLGIETTQYLTDLGRTADVNDLITNTLGAVLGWVVAHRIRLWARSAALAGARDTTPGWTAPQR
ncbi:VanZ family protein [Herbiconiux moechotypicola]|uniref:VanZ-like domain-containing protein n=1 Tax=Herbiconiux moechotypicola TaxID=637393 RepID=A0ABN3DPS5_9MICO|nr:VanZ family protein [Herbiconiux moechotypicola]MCS5731710.1 VanZ family protein [Herbiconiux moechotypicola]